MEPAVQRIVDRVQSREPMQVEAVIPYSSRPRPKNPKPQAPSPKPRTASFEVPALRSLGEGGAQ